MDYFGKAEVAKKKTAYVTAKENLQIMLLEIKTRVLTEEKRDTLVTDCNELDGKDEEITKIEYKSSEIVSVEIINVENPQYALVTYRGYIFKIDDNLNIIEEKNEEGYDEELLNYKKVIAKTLTDLGVETSYKQPVKDYINNIKILADKNYEEGKESDIVLLKSDLSSKYVQELSLSNIEEYENFDEDDFIIVNKNMAYEYENDHEYITNITKTYNKQNGTLTLGKQKDNAGGYVMFNIYNLYATKRKIRKIVTKQDISTNTNENLDEFKNKLIKFLEDEYKIENNEENLLLEKTGEEISEYIRNIAKKKYKEGISEYMVLIQADLSTRYDQTVSVSNIENYKNLVLSDFLIVNKSIAYEKVNDREDILTMSQSYDANTGTLQFGKQKSFASTYTFWNICDVYLLKKQLINLEELIKIETNII